MEINATSADSKARPSEDKGTGRKDAPKELKSAQFSRRRFRRDRQNPGPPPSGAKKENPVHPQPTPSSPGLGADPSSTTIGMNPFHFDTSLNVVFGNVSTTGYVRLVVNAYDALADVTPRLALHLTKMEWLHAHMLMFAARIQLVNFRLLGTYYPKEQKAVLPDRIRVFLPIWEALHCLGVVEDDLINTRWVPVCTFPSGESYDKDDDLRYDWDRSWKLVLNTRTKRSKREPELFASRHHVADVEPEDPEEVEEKAPTQAKDEDEDSALPEEEVPESWEDDANESEFLEAMMKKYPKDYPSFPIVDVNAGLTDASVNGKLLHWDQQLWHDYNRAISELGSKVMLSIDVPKTPDGHYGWVLQVARDVNGYVAWAPHAKVPPFANFFAVLLDFGRFGEGKVDWFSVKSSSLIDPVSLLLKWIHAFCPDKRAN